MYEVCIVYLTLKMYNKLQLQYFVSDAARDLYKELKSTV